MPETSGPQLETWLPHASPPNGRRSIDWRSYVGVGMNVVGMALCALGLLHHFIWPLLWGGPFYLLSGGIELRRLVTRKFPETPNILEMSALSPYIAMIGQTVLLFGISAPLINHFFHGARPASGWMETTAALAGFVGPIPLLSLFNEWFQMKVGYRAATRTWIAVSVIGICVGLCFSPAPIAFRAVIFIGAFASLLVQTLAPDFQLNHIAGRIGPWLRRRNPALADRIWGGSWGNEVDFGPDAAEIPRVSYGHLVRVPAHGVDRYNPRAFKRPYRVREGNWATLNSGRCVFVAVVEERTEKWAIISERELSPEEIAERRASGRWEPLVN